MKVCNWTKIHSLAVKQVAQPAVYVCNGLDFERPEDDAIWRFITGELRAVYGRSTEFYDITAELTGHKGSLFFFDTIEEQQRFYTIFEQPLTDSSAVYACTYTADGECQTENT